MAKKNFFKSMTKLSNDLNKSTIDILARRLNEVEYQLSKNQNLENLKKLSETTLKTEKQLIKMRNQRMRQTDSNRVYSQLKKVDKLKTKINSKITSVENSHINSSYREDIKYLNFIRDLLKDKVDPYKISSININDHLNICLYPNHFICDIYLNKIPHQIKVANKEYGSISFDFDEMEDLKEIQDIFLSALDIYK